MKAKIDTELMNNVCCGLYDSTQKVIIELFSKYNFPKEYLNDFFEDTSNAIYKVMEKYFYVEK